MDKEGELRRLSRNLALITAELRRSDQDIRDLVDDGGEALPMLDKMSQAVAVIASLLRAGAPLMAMSQAHLPGLHVWLDWIGAQADVMAASTRDGTGHVLLVPKSLKNCVYPTKQRDPSKLEERPSPSTSTARPSTRTSSSGGPERASAVSRQ